MVTIIVSVRDSALNAFMQPWFVPAVGAAIRSFQDEVVRVAADNVLSRHPDDYELFELGAFDDSAGRFTLLAEPRLLVRGKDFAEVNHGSKS